MNEFNQITTDIENEHTRNGTEINHDGEIVVVDTAWACGSGGKDAMEPHEITSVFNILDSLWTAAQLSLAEG